METSGNALTALKPFEANDCEHGHRKDISRHGCVVVFGADMSDCSVQPNVKLKAFHCFCCCIYIKIFA